VRVTNYLSKKAQSKKESLGDFLVGLLFKRSQETYSSRVEF